MKANIQIQTKKCATCLFKEVANDAPYTDYNIRGA